MRPQPRRPVIAVVRRQPPPAVIVPKLWPNSTIVCIGSGPSLTQADVNLVRGKARVIVVNDAYKLAPWADVLWACDDKWWKWAHTDTKRHPTFSQFTGLKFALTKASARWPGVQVVKHTGSSGLERHPAAVKHGHNSGYQAINAAVHLGATRIVLLGYDMGGDHFFGKHPDNSKPPFAKCLKQFPTLVEPLKALGIEVVNCTRKTALHAFPKQPLEAVFP